ncbi:hypothetical protein Tco_1509671 [Tanacetum coccineum]
MDDPNITMEEYIRLEEEKTRRHGQKFNWQTATFRKVENHEDEDDCPIDFETEFPAIVFDNTLTAIPSEPTVCPPNENKVDFRISLDESDDEDYTVIFDENLFLYKIISVNDLKMDSGNDKPFTPNHTVDYFGDLDYFKDFENEFPSIIYNDGLTSKSDLEIKPLVSSERIDEFNLIDEVSLSEYDEEISLEGDEITHGENGLSETNMAPLLDADQRHPWLRYQIEEYTEGIRHRIESPETRQDLAVRLRMVYSGEGHKRWGWMLRIHYVFSWEVLGGGWHGGGVRRRMAWRQFILALGLHMEQEMAEARDFLGPAHFYVLIRDPVKRLCHRMIAYGISGRGGEEEQGQDAVTRELSLIDLHELRRLHICTRYGDTLAWVAQGPERQEAAVASAQEDDKAGQAAKEVAPEIPAPAHAPPPAPQPHTMSHRIERVEEEVHDLRRDVVGLQGVVESFTTEQSRVSTWLISCMTQLMDAIGHTYQPFDSTLVGSLRLSFRRRVRLRTSYASTSTAPRIDAQPDP